MYSNRVSLSFGVSTFFFFLFFLLFNGDQIEVSLFPFFYYSIIGERKFETRECPLNYKHIFK